MRTAHLALLAGVLLLQIGRASASCQLGTLFLHLKQVEAKCCAKSGENDNDCSKTGFPDHEGTCSEDCGKVLEPFWDACGPTLTSLRLAPAGMARFYDKCIAQLYEPGEINPRRVM